MTRILLSTSIILFLLSCSGLKKTDRLMNRGLNAVNKGKYKKAVKLFSKSIEADPSNLDAYLNRGTAYNDLELYDLSQKDYLFLISKNYSNPDLYYNLGKNYHDQKEFKKVLDSYNTAILMDSLNSDYHNNKGTTLSYLKLYKEAVVEYEKALILNPKDKIVIKNLGLSYYDAQQFQFSKKYLLQAVENKTKEYEVFLKLSKIYSLDNDNSNACLFFKSAQKSRIKYDEIDTLYKPICK